MYAAEFACLTPKFLCFTTVRQADITAIGDHIRQLKAAKADKAVISEEVKHRC